ncbi:unnamed protein product [Orchesella dallaii]|uniref:Diacylglycerol O-acyltransferase n=1 Tax=Orchesella dallaii TaxID=48710 RepID=A0ABP1R7L3_9HEXA
MKHTKASEESNLHFLFRIFWSSIVGIFIIIPGFMILYVINETLRFIANTRLRRKYGSKTHVLEEGSDAVWLYKAQNGKRQILYLAINDEPMDLEKHRQNYLDKVLCRPAYQKLKQIFAVDFGFNIQKYDKDFDIKKHVKIFEGSEDRVFTEDELMDHVLPVLSEEMDDSKPQWEDVIIPKFKYERTDSKLRSARVFRVHHAYMDGGSNLLMIADTQYEGKDKFPFVVDPTAPPKIALWKRALYKFNCVLLFAWVILHGLYAPTAKVVRNRFRTPKLSGKTNYGWSKPVPMELLQKIRTATGQSMPTILMSVLGGAIRKLNDKFPCKRFSDNDQNEITVGMVAGIFPYPDLKLKNRHSIFHMKIDVSDKTPLSRLASTCGTMQKAVWDPHAYLNLFIPGLFGRTPIWFSDACMSVMGFPLVLSNIPVAQKQVKLWDNEVLDIGGWPPMLSICGIGLVTIRYGDGLRFCVNSDKTAISKEELDFLISQIIDEVHNLAREVGHYQHRASSPVDKKPLLNFEDNFLQLDQNNKSSLRFRLNNSINTIKDSLYKIRDP